MKKVFLAAAALCLASGVAAQAPEFEEGVHYHRIDNVSPVDPGGVEVVEIFSYACPACAQFQPVIARWEEDAPEYVTFRRLPLAGQPAWSLLAQGYHTASVLGIVEDGHAAMFNALHTQRRRIRNLEDLAEFWAEHGTSTDEFMSTAQSFAIDARMRQAQANAGRWQVSATPTLVVNGKYRLGAGNQYPGNQTWTDVIAVLDFLVEKEGSALVDQAVDEEDTAESEEDEVAADQTPAS